MIAKILKSTGSYNDNHFSLFEKEVQCRDIKKGEILLKQGAICQSVFYTIEGSVFQYNFKEEIDLNVIDLHIANEWFLNQQSFVAQKPSETFIEAYSDSTILELSVHALHRLIGQSPAFFQLGKVLEQPHSRLYFFDKTLSPLEKYQYILTHKPQLIQAFPLKLIASYLKITPETLSRVREKLSKEKSVS
jgi:CRP-like cAMP-binding protein